MGQIALHMRGFGVWFKSDPSEPERDRIEARRIEYGDTKDYILTKHYAQRMPMITYAFGLFINDELRGVCTFGKPASPTLCRGVCGDEHESSVFELNRLVVDDGLPKNSLSQFVSKCLKQLKKDDLIIVSYADDGKGHHGYIYQATNWIYTGMTKRRTEKYSGKNKHSRHYDESMKHLRKVRTSKHRYVYFTGKSRKIFKSALSYSIQPYPKGENRRYVLGERLPDLIENRRDNTEFWE